MTEEIQKLKRLLEKEKLARLRAEEAVIAKTNELNETHKQLLHIEKTKTKDLELLANFPAQNASPVMRIKQDGIISYANRSSIKLLSFWNTMVGDKCPSSIFEAVQVCLEKEMNIELEITDEFDDGKIYSFILSPVSKYNCVFAYGHDITFLKRTQNALNDTKNLYMELVEEATDIIYRTNLVGRFTYVNPASTAVVEFTKDELLGKSYLSLIRKDYRDKAMLFYANQLETRTPESYFEFPILTKSRRELWVGQNSKIVYQDGKPIGFHSVTRNITDLKITQQELVKAREKAEQSVRAKEHFLANMSHEIRTPMNAIIGMSNLLEQTNLTSQQQSYLNAISISGKNLLVIINDILDFSKIESNKMVFERIGFTVSSVVENLIKTISYKAEEKALTLTCHIDESISKVLIGDPSRLNQILLNLVNNALKFTKEGGVHIEGKLEHETSDTNRIYFSVTDTGIGISKDKQDAIFESFTQEDESITRQFGGTGLGLSICKELVELQGGVIKLESEKNKGTTFYFTLGEGQSEKNNK